MSGSRLRVVVIGPASRLDPGRRVALDAAGWRFEAGDEVPELLARLRSDPPDVVVIDLGRRPSQGRDLGVFLRRTKTTRAAVLIFVGGGDDAREGIRGLLPDAVLASWDGILDTVEEAVRNRPAEPVVPDSVFAPYAGRPLAAKLGIRAGHTVALDGAPRGFEGVLGELPPGAVVTRARVASPGATVWFVRGPEELEVGIAERAERIGAGGLWIAWPKGGSARRGELTQAEVRRAGLAAGLVDHKICSIDRTWSALRFVRRRS